MKKILSVIIMGYGLTFFYRRYEGEANPNKKNYDSDGSVPKFKWSANTSEFSNWQFVVKLFYNYTFILRIELNR